MELPKFEPHDFNNDTLLPFRFHLDRIGGRLLGCVPNWHQSLEILYFIEGDGQVICDSLITDVTAGDVFVINSYNIHQVISQTSFVRYYCLLIGSTFYSENDIDLNSFAIRNRIMAEPARLAYEKVIAAYQENGRFRIAGIRSAVLSLLIYLGENDIVDQAVDARTVGNRGLEHIRLAIDYIRTHFTERITIDDIANEVSVSKYHLSRIFKEATKYSLVSYINLLRCQYAQNLLATTQQSISAIAAASGYENLSYFTRSYKTMIGILPSATRRTDLPAE